MPAPHEIALTPTDAGTNPKLADAVTAAVREAADHGDHVTPDRFRAGLAELRADLTRRMPAVAGLAITAIRLIPRSAR